MVSCCLVADGYARICCLLTGQVRTRSRPTPVVGRVDRRSAHHTRHLRAEEVARPWTGVQAAEQFRGLAVRRPRDQAQSSDPIGMAHPGDPVGAT
jgi:hypothetical protein